MSLPQFRLRVLFWIAVNVIPCSLNAQTREANRGTLILIGATSSSITLASDSASFGEGKAIANGAQKIFPVGTFGACIFVGSTKLQYLSGSKVMDEVSFIPFATEWLKQHRSPAVRDAYNSVRESIFASIHAFQKRHLDFVGDPNHTFASFGCVGYEISTSPLMFSSDYYAPDVRGAAPRVSKIEIALRPGIFIPLGRDKVSLELLEGNSREFLSEKLGQAVAKYMLARKSGTRNLLTTDDFLGLSKACLLTTESPMARQFDSQTFQVLPPNRFAVIDAKSGFRWVHSVD